MTLTSGYEIPDRQYVTHLCSTTLPITVTIDHKLTRLIQPMTPSIHPERVPATDLTASGRDTAIYESL